MVNSSSITRCLAVFGIDVNFAECGDIQLDSRLIKPSDVFLAVPGHDADGRNYIKSAIANGAAVVVIHTDNKTEHGHVEQQGNLDGSEHVHIVSFFDLQTQLAAFSATYYEHPSKKLQVVGVTGTNGKTSTCYFIAQLFSLLGKPSAVIGTIGTGVYGKSLLPLENTTPSACHLQQLFTSFVNQQVETVAMEVSSHALSQGRIEPTAIDVAIFTNLTRDHLDYHHTMAAYAKAKQSLFVDNNKQVWLLNIDDPLIQTWSKSWSTAPEKVLISVAEDFDFSNYSDKFIHATQIEYIPQGMRFVLNSSWGQTTVNCALFGLFNISNLLSAIAVALLNGESLTRVAELVAAIRPVPGRMETFTAPDMPTCVVDYAHTPDALVKALTSARQHCLGKLWAVFGCGGDRDAGKRPEMGKAAAQLADHVIVTNDNPRTESAQLIAEQIVAGMPDASITKIILDREKAIKFALEHAGKTDLVLCAGKGHEDYVIIGRERLPYNEREVVSSYYQNRTLS